MYELVPIEIAASGMTTQRIRSAVIASNLANASTTRRPDGEGPYLRRMTQVRADLLPQFSEMLSELQAQADEGDRLDLAAALDEPRRSGKLLEEHLRGVHVQDIVESPQTRQVYDPGHPDANEEGYVQYPDISVIQEMTDMISASRNYEANLSVLKNTRDMLMQTLELLRS